MHYFCSHFHPQNSATNNTSTVKKSNAENYCMRAVSTFKRKFAVKL